MYVIKHKTKDLYYCSGGQNWGMTSLENCTKYNTERGAKISLGTLKYWYNAKTLSGNDWFHPELHADIASLDDLEIIPIKITL